MLLSKVAQVTKPTQICPGCRQRARCNIGLPLQDLETAQGPKETAFSLGGGKSASIGNVVSLEPVYPEGVLGWSPGGKAVVVLEGGGVATAPGTSLKSGRFKRLP